MNKKIIKIISLLLSAVMVCSLCACSVSEDTEDEEIVYKNAVPTNNVEIVNRLNDVIAAAQADKPAVAYSLDQSAGDAECENSNLQSAFKTVANMVTDNDFGEETEYGEDATKILPANGVDKVEKLLISDIRTAYVTDNSADESYTLFITLNGDENPEQADSIYGKFYSIEADNNILENFQVVSNVMTAKSYSATYGVGTIKAVIDKATDHITKLELHRDVKIETAVTGVGTLASIGTDLPLTFTYSSTENFSFDWDNPATDTVES